MNAIGPQRNYPPYIHSPKSEAHLYTLAGITTKTQAIEAVEFGFASRFPRPYIPWPKSLNPKTLNRGKMSRPTPIRELIHSPFFLAFKAPGNLPAEPRDPSNSSIPYSGPKILIPERHDDSDVNPVP